MITLAPGSKLVESVSELPNFTDAKEVFLDVETKNNTYTELKAKNAERHSGMYPYKGDRIGGFAVSVDDCPDVYYIPLRHTRGTNLPLEPVRQWLRDLLCQGRDWINHNVVFDAAFMHYDEVEFKCRLVDTLTLSKVHDSDRMGHGLKDLCREWLDMPMAEQDEVALWLKEAKSHDWADVPPDIMGEYACMDVHGNRRLYRHLVDKRPEQLKGIWDTEIQLAPILYDMEMDGMRIDPTACKVDTVHCLRKMVQLTTEISDISDREFTNSATCLYDILINLCGLPVLAFKKERVDGRLIETDRPTFDKHALPLYEMHPTVTASEELTRLIKAIREYRQESQHYGLFLSTFLALHDDNNRIHPSYNAVVRTGRMSGRRPNAQQQNKRSKALILPDEGYGFLSLDYSQIEYRLIVHFIKDMDAIRAYNEDPNTDFHKWVASEVGVERDAGKALNFGMAYGAGKKTVTTSLASNHTIIGEIGEIVNQLVESGELPAALRGTHFEALCSDRASTVYQAYHERFPGIKRTANRAASAARKRGYIFNPYGRRRHLPTRFCHKAFNSLIQGCAMDIMKERMIALSPRYNSKSRAMGLRMSTNVHDEMLLQAPLETVYDLEAQAYICDTLESPNIEFSVPIKTGLGVSAKNWAEAGGKDTVKDSNGNIIGGKIR